VNSNFGKLKNVWTEVIFLGTQCNDCLQITFKKW
jgi:hypothetical protein